MKSGKCNVLDSILYSLVIIGGLNWGMVGAFDLNLVELLFDAGTTLTKATYIIIGVASLYAVVKCVMCHSSKCCSGKCDSKKK